MRAARFFGRLDEAVPAEDLRAFVQVPRLRDAPSQVGDESPVGYLPLALAAAAGDPTVPGATLARLRLAALAMALLWVLALYWAGSRIGGGPLGAALAAAGAFLPLGGLASATAAPDLVPALFAALWLGSLPVAAGPGRRGGRWRVLRLALAGLAALSKRSGLFLVPLALAVEAWAWRRGGAAAGTATGTLRKVGFFNHTGRDLDLVIEGKAVKLPKKSYLNAELPVKFTWKADGNEAHATTVPDGAAGVDVLFKE